MAITRPTATPLFATDPTFSSGLESGLAPRLDPGAGIRGQGILPESRIAARWLNHEIGVHGDWLTYLDSKTLARQAQNWPERASTPSSMAGTSGSDIALAYGPGMGIGAGGRIVAYNDALNVATSEDGIVWINRASVASASFTSLSVSYGLISGVSNFLIAGNGAGGFYKSADGITWAFVAGGPGDAQSAYAQSLPMWVRAGNAGLISSSPDGVAWTARTAPGPWIAGCGGVKRLVWNGSLFVALPLASYGKCLTSPDGITWTERALPAIGFWTGLAYSSSDGLWIASSNGPVIATSTDGLTWVGLSTAQANNDIQAIGSLWVIALNAGAFGGILYSYDKGQSWFAVEVGNHATVAGWKRLLVANNRFIAAKSTGVGVGIDFAMSMRQWP